MEGVLSPADHAGRQAPCQSARATGVPPSAARQRQPANFTRAVGANQTCRQIQRLLSLFLCLWPVCSMHAGLSCHRAPNKCFSACDKAKGRKRNNNNNKSNAESSRQKLSVFFWLAANFLWRSLRSTSWWLISLSRASLRMQNRRQFVSFRSPQTVPLRSGIVSQLEPAELAKLAENEINNSGNTERSHSTQHSIDE